MSKTIVFLLLLIFPFLSCKSYEHSVLPDLQPKLLAGSTFRDEANPRGGELLISDNAKLLKFLKNRKAPFLFMSSVPKAESLKIVNFNTREWFLLSILCGGVIGSETGKLNKLMKRHLENIKFREGMVLIINNIQIDVTTKWWLEYWNNYLGSLISRTNKYKVVAEIAQISPEDLLAYIKGEKNVKVETATAPPVAKQKIILFRGIVHKVMGSTVMVKSSRTYHARPGVVVLFLDRTGRQVASGRVRITFHTNVQIGLIKGRPQKGYTAVVYKKN